MMETTRRKRTWVYLFMATGSVLLLAIAAFTATSLFALKNTAYLQTEDNLRQFCYAITHFLDAEPAHLEPPSLQKFCMSLGNKPNFRMTYIAHDGTVLADSLANPATLENHKDRPEVAGALAGKEEAIVRYSDSLGRKLVYYAVPYRNDVIRLAVSVNYVDVAERRMALGTVIAALLIFLISIAVSLLVSTRIVVPLRLLEDAAHSYAGGKLDVPFDRSHFPREFTELADTFSLMAARLQEKILALDEQNTETEAILASMNDALIVLDKSGLVVRINRAAEELFGISADDANGIPLIQAVRNTDIVDYALNRRKDETERAIELRTIGRDGPRYLLAQLNEIEGGAGKLLMLSDITRLKNLERIRKDFVANVSHELKTPVTSIQGFIETLKDGAINDPAATKRFLDIMDQQSARLGAIIDDLLSISRLEQGERATIAREISSIPDLLENVRNLCQEHADKKQTSLVITMPKKLDCSVNPGLIEQAITNLVLNAIKYSPDKSTVSVRVWLDDASKHLVCTVSDNGIGIPEKDLSRIFERFYRVDKGRSRAVGGTGLGLSIVRHIALAHGGSVSVESREGEGSTFRLDIPV